MAAPTSYGGNTYGDTWAVIGGKNYGTGVIYGNSRPKGDYTYMGTAPRQVWGGRATGGWATQNLGVWVPGGSDGGGGSNSGGGGGNSNPANDGTYGNVTALYEKQLAEAAASAEAYRKKTAEEIKTLQINMDQRLADSQAAADAKIASLNDLMLTQQNEAALRFQASQDELQAANAAYAEQVRANTALSKAFVPSLEPTAAGAQMGDQRESQTLRKVINNELSSLSITSGIGSNTNPLAGLQLA